MPTAIYPGSFDPITNGHRDIIERAVEVFEHVIVAVLQNTTKSGIFTTPERVELIRQVVGSNPKVSVESFSGLTADFARQKGVRFLIRGLRAVSDFDAELRIALMNRKLNPDLDTVFLMTRAENLFLSSSTVKEIAMLGGDSSGLVPPVVADRLKERFKPAAAG
ncbi:MAG: pantetheine-phosphate adenylyltransferase [Candidatus Sericytochromatia bacterium]|uniref:Phosphopantetheine adenylyltransferase n=1 Tax=Candidatus Tanganyikabacteria bacterium TaxID=2961651 RepID=A0A938BMK8_9BACT|nr:pantetheine-phosphate adenylyltransferase [Candidatus Tanganyikabacteria bacterium]